jgi:hypothetical protein
VDANALASSRPSWSRCGATYRRISVADRVRLSSGGASAAASAGSSSGSVEAGGTWNASDETTAHSRRGRVRPASGLPIGKVAPSVNAWLRNGYHVARSIEPRVRKPPRRTGVRAVTTISSAPASPVVPERSFHQP